MAPALAAVKLSTSSTLISARNTSTHGSITNHDHDEAIGVVNHLVDSGKEALDEFPRLGEPFGEEGM